MRKRGIDMYEYYDYSANGNKSDTAETVQTAAVDSKEAAKRAKKQKKLEKRQNRKKTWGKIGVSAGLGLAFGIMAGGAFISVTRVANYFFPVKNEQTIEDAVGEQPKGKEIEIPYNNTASVPEKPEKPAGEVKPVSMGMNVSDVVDNAMPSIVSITNKSVQQVRSMWGMGIQEYESTSVGSGIILGKNDEELLIVTNNHVIEGANSLTVGFIDDEIYEAYAKGSDSDRDLAVVAVKLSSLSEDTVGKISMAVLGDSDDLKVGEQVVAIGNALGYGQSVTTGIVSALDREVTIENITNNLIQTDAAINPGNSGGALLNMNGELIGINSAKFASAQVEGMGYAIPIETVKPIVEELMNRETRDKREEPDAGYLGITGLNVDSSVSEMYGIPEGVYLQEVTDGSPADEAGLIKGDVITKLDGSSVGSIAKLKEMLLYYSPGEQVEIVYYRADNGEYEQKKVTVTLGSRKGTPLDPDNKSSDGDENASSDDESVGDGNSSGSSGGNGSQWFFDFNDIFGW